MMKAIFRPPLLGGLSGLAALALDEFLAWSMLGYRTPLYPRFVAAYLLAGMGLGVLLELALGRRLARRPRPRDRTMIATGMALIYTLPIFERVSHVLGSEVTLGGIVVAIVAVAAFLAGFAVLRRVTRSTFWAALLAAFTAAFGLAVNCNLLGLPQEPQALAADAAIMLAALAAAWLVRIGRARGGRMGLVAAAGGAVLVALVAFISLDEPVTVPAAAPPAGEPPHLVVIVIDSLRLDVFQRVVEETEEGRSFHRAFDGAAWFTNAIAAAPWTAPSVGSMLTGLYPSEHGFGKRGADRTPARLAKSISTLTERLRDHGYVTEGLVTNPLLHPATGIDRGFTHYEALLGPSVKLPLLTALAEAGLLRLESSQGGIAIRRRLERRLDPVVASGRPFVFWLHYMEPHVPLFEHPDLAPDPAAGDPDSNERLYRDEVRYVVRELTRVRELFARRDLGRRTAFVLVADHGEMFPSDGRQARVKRPDQDRPMLEGHGHSLYGELMRVPLVIRPPGGLVQERRVDVLASHVDLYVTVGDLLGLDLPPVAGDQVSLAPWLAAETPPGLRGRSHVLIGGNTLVPEQRGIRTSELKLIEYHGDRGRPSELYHVAADPREQRNLARQDQRRSENMSQLLIRAWARLREPPETAPVEFDRETRKHLKALGYLQ
ncbi:MAG: sulfatase-like hydrolase/transferase [bacterium]|nr:sulfatase-like hydrolase/transferase [bacterium]